jgi:hypothetical protein
VPFGPKKVKDDSNGNREMAEGSKRASNGNREMTKGSEMPAMERRNG